MGCETLRRAPVRVSMATEVPSSLRLGFPHADEKVEEVADFKLHTLSQKGLTT